MRWMAGTALIVAVLALGLQLSRPSGAQSAGPRYQIVLGPDEHVVRLDTRTGEMVSFVIGAHSLIEGGKRALKAEGGVEFFEIARSAKEVQP